MNSAIVQKVKKVNRCIGMQAKAFLYTKRPACRVVFDHDETCRKYMAQHFIATYNKDFCGRSTQNIT